MDPTSIVAMLVIGAVAGWLAGTLTSGGGFGLVTDILIGIGGALVAGFLFPSFLPFGGLIGQIVSSTLGAIILLFVIRLIKRAT
jgi:uncharacterized membrane protein YeaQ/YmgE (transglycosylase-associated protein family)